MDKNRLFQQHYDNSRNRLFLMRYNDCEFEEVSGQVFSEVYAGENDKYVMNYIHVRTDEDGSVKFNISLSNVVETTVRSINDVLNRL